MRAPLARHARSIDYRTASGIDPGPFVVRGSTGGGSAVPVSAGEGLSASGLSRRGLSRRGAQPVSERRCALNAAVRSASTVFAAPSTDRTGAHSRTEETSHAASASARSPGVSRSYVQV